MHMKALQDRGIVKEGVIARLHKRIELLTDEEEQYKGAIRSLNKELKNLKGKLQEEGHQRKSEQEAKEKVEKELTTLFEQVETARVDAVNDYKASQSLIDLCGRYYGEGFEDYLNQVKSLYPHLDFSKVTMDEPLPSTPADDTIHEETDDSTEFNPKDGNVVLAQLVTDALVSSLVPSIEPVNVEDNIAWEKVDVVREKVDGNSPSAS